MTLKPHFFWPCVLLAGAICTVAADSATSTGEKQHKFILQLQSGAPAADKAIACKQLALCGTQEAVPALEPLLYDEALASWARIALEAIPGPAPEEALRRALGKLQGRLLVGAINSLGNRRDPAAASGLVKKLHDADPEVESAAAWALGRIGGTQAAKALKRSLASAPVEVRPAAAEGCILCAEGLLAQGKSAQAIKLFDAVRQAKVPEFKVLEATRGAILARQSAGLPLLLEQLRASDKARFGIGLRTARELPGRTVTEALAAELDRTSADRQPVLLLALADREDPAALPAILNAAGAGSTKLRIVAVGVLERLGDISGVPVLLETAVSPDAPLAQAALGALARLPSNAVDSNLCARLPQSSGQTRRVLIQLVEQRRIDAALPAIVAYAGDADAGVRAAAVQTVGILGDDRQAADLVRLLQKTQDAKERDGIGAALIAISGRNNVACVPHLLALEQSSDGGLRVIALHALSSAGGPHALAAVKAATEDSEEAVQDEAVRTLSTWPNNWPEDEAVAQPLLSLAESGKKTSYQVLALRGYLQYIEGNKKLRPEERVSMVSQAVPLIKRPDEKRLAITIIGAAPSAESLELLVTFAGDPDVAEDACSSLVKLADKKTAGLSQEQRQKALQTVVQKTKNEDTKKTAAQQLQATEESGSK